MEDYYNQLIMEKISKDDQQAIRYIIDEAYKLTNKFYENKNNYRFMNPIGIDLRADILRVLIASVAEKVYPAQSHKVFKSCYKRNAIGNCRHLELNSDDSTLLFALASSKHDIGNDSIYRRNILDNNQQSLFEQVFKEEHIRALLVTYGVAASDEPDFVILGLPGKKSWIGRVPLVKPVSNANTLTNAEFLNTNEEEEILAQLPDSIFGGGRMIYGGKAK